MNDESPILNQVDSEKFLAHQKKALMGNMKDLSAFMKTDFLKQKMQQQETMQQSIEDGGPASTQEALLILLKDVKLGVRALSLEIGVKRGQLTDMLEGRRDMSPEVFDKIYRAIDRRKPELLNSNL